MNTSKHTLSRLLLMLLSLSLLACSKKSATGPEQEFQGVPAGGPSASDHEAAAKRERSTLSSPAGPSAQKLALDRKACAQGKAKACYRIGSRHHHGRGKAKNNRKAAAYFERACKGGVMAGCHDLGSLYFWGRGVPKNMARAIALSRRACRKGYAQACRNMGFAFFRGQGVKKDPAKGKSFLKKACQGGNKQACRDLGAK